MKGGEVETVDLGATDQLLSCEIIQKNNWVIHQVMVKIFIVVFLLINEECLERMKDFLIFVSECHLMLFFLLLYYFVTLYFIIHFNPVRNEYIIVMLYFTSLYIWYCRIWIQCCVILCCYYLYNYNLVKNEFLQK